MTPKCNYCELFGKKPHCNNCKVANQNINERPPQEMDCTLEELVEYINGGNDLSDRFVAGDYKYIDLFPRERVKMVLLETNADELIGGGRAKASFGIFNVMGTYRMNESRRGGGYLESDMHTVILPRFRGFLPEVIRANLKPVKKIVPCFSQGNFLPAEAELDIWLFSESEVTSQCRRSQIGEEGKTYDFFANGGLCAGNRTWLRSRNNSASYCCIDARMSPYYQADDANAKISFGFCL